MDIFEYAMDMEKDGEKYYRELAEKYPHDRGMNKILRMLADDEVKHYNILKEMKSEHKGDFETNILDDAKNVFKEMREQDLEIDTDGSQKKLYLEAQDIEKKSIDFYAQKANEVTDPWQKEIFLRLAEEEKRHYFLLDNVIELVTRPETWLENAEWHHLDKY